MGRIAHAPVLLRTVHAQQVGAGGEQRHLAGLATRPTQCAGGKPHFHIGKGVVLWEVGGVLAGGALRACGAKRKGWGLRVRV